MNIPLKGNLACKKCTSSDAVTLYQNPETQSKFYKCYSCGEAYSVKGTEITSLNNILEKDLRLLENYVGTGNLFKIKEPYRGITVDTLEKYGVLQDQDGVIVFPNFDYNGNHVANHFKVPRY